MGVYQTWNFDLCVRAASNHPQVWTSDLFDKLATDKNHAHKITYTSSEPMHLDITQRCDDQVESCRRCMLVSWSLNSVRPFFGWQGRFHVNTSWPMKPSQACSANAHNFPKHLQMKTVPFMFLYQEQQTIIQPKPPALFYTHQTSSNQPGHITMNYW
jgi:hypothetical protein